MDTTNQGQSFYLLRLDKGEELKEKLEEFCKDHAIDIAWINAIGSTQAVELGYYDLEAKKYRTKKFDETLEIVSVMGDVVLKDGKHFMHAHGSFAKRSMEMVGGHIMRCVIGATCEIAVMRGEGEIGRKFDKEIGLHLLCQM
jgi:uncharacterized protein